MEQSKQLTLGEAQQLCFLSVIQMFNQQRSNGNVSIIKTKCQSQEIAQLRKKGENLPARAARRMIPAICKNLPDDLLFRERLWGLKIGDMVVFDTGNYSLNAILKIALNIPMAKAYSDRIIHYYSNGKRKMFKVPTITLINRFRTPPMRGWTTLGLAKAAELFPNEISKPLFRELSKFLLPKPGTDNGPDDLETQIANSNYHFLTDPEVKTLVAASDEASDYYIPFNCVLNGRNVSLQHSDEILTEFSGYGNLQPLFAEFSALLKKGQYSVIKNNRDLHVLTRSFYQSGAKLKAKAQKKAAQKPRTQRIADEILAKADVSAETYEPGMLYHKNQELELLVGIADISYDEALLIAADKNELKRRHAAGEKLFCVNADGEILNAHSVINSKKFKPGKSKVLLLPDEVYESWGEIFSPKVLQDLNRKREFSYLQSNNFANNLVGQTPNGNTEENTMARRLLEMPALGFKTVDDVDVEKLGQDLMDGKISLEQIGKRFTKVAMMIEETSWGEGAHYSSPERHGNLTGYPYERR